MVPFHRNFQPVQVGHHVRPGDLRAQQPVNPLRLQGQLPGLGHKMEDIDGAVQHVAAIQQLHQLAGPLHRRNGKHGVQVFLKLAGGLGAQAQGQGSLPDGSTVEIGGLKHHRGGIRHNLRVFAAHDARQANGLFPVGNHQHPRLQPAHRAVQGGDGLPFPALPHHDFAGGHVPVVKGMHGLAIFQHDIVGDVHNVVDGPHAVGPQPLPQPLGGGANAHIGHHPGGVPVAQGLRRHFHIQILENGAGIAALHHRGVVVHGQGEGGGSLPGQADDGVAVRPVVGDLKLHHRIVVANDGVDVIARLAVLLQNPNAVFLGVGKIPQGQAQLLQGAEHAVGPLPPELPLGDVHAPRQPGIVQRHRHQIPLAHVLGAGDNLHRLGLAHIHLADPHVVRVLVAHNGNYPAHHHVPDPLIQPLIGLHLLPNHGHGIHKCLVRYLG